MKINYLLRLNPLLKDGNFLDYVTPDIEEFIPLLKQEITRIQLNSTAQREIPITNSTTTKNEEVIEIQPNKTEQKVKKVCNWTAQEANLWFKKKKITNLIFENLSPCDGKLLEQLHVTLNQVPEFFHSILRADSKASLKEIVTFTGELRDLFKNSTD